MSDDYDKGPFAAGSTRVGMPPVMRLPAVPVLHRSVLPDIDGLAHDPPALELAILDLCANAIWNFEDRAELADSDVHMLQVCKIVERLDLERTGKDAQIEELQRQLTELKLKTDEQARQMATLRSAEAEARARADAHRKAYERERDVSIAHAEYAQELLELNETRRQETDMARRTLSEVMSQLFKAKSALAEHEAKLLSLDRVALNGRRACPPAVETFDSPRRMARGTNPENETVVVDVGLMEGGL